MAPTISTANCSVCHVAKAAEYSIVVSIVRDAIRTAIVAVNLHYCIVPIQKASIMVMVIITAIIVNIRNGVSVAASNVAIAKTAMIA